MFHNHLLHWISHTLLSMNDDLQRLLSDIEKVNTVLMEQWI